MSRKMSQGKAEVDNPCVVLTGHGGYEKLIVAEASSKEPDSNEIVVEMYACGLNFADLMARQGLYDRCPKPPYTPGMEGSGVVAKVGSSVEDFKPGDRVGLMCPHGSWTSHVTVPEHYCFLLPAEMTFLEAAAIPVNYVTAYQMLFDMGGLAPGKSVLVQMAAGGVGIAATQICKSVKDVTVFGTASAHKHSTIKGIGVDHPIDYRNKDFEEEVRKISPEGVDIVLDPLLGIDGQKGFSLLKPFGKIIHFGAANMVTGESRSLLQVAKTWFRTKSYSPLSLTSSNRCVCGYHLGHLSEHVELVRNTLRSLVELYEEGVVRPRIDSVWHFSQVGNAMAQMHERRNIGKVILTPKESVAQEFKQAKE